LRRRPRGTLDIKRTQYRDKCTVRIERGDEKKNTHRNVAEVTGWNEPSYSLADGTLIGEGNKCLTIQAYGPFFNFLPGSIEQSRTIAHEAGHVIGLGDVYKTPSDPSGAVFDTSDALMGDGSRKLNHIGQPDINGVAIIRGDPWMYDAYGRKYWGAPGTFYSGGWRQAYTGAWYFFAPNERQVSSYQVMLAPEANTSKRMEIENKPQAPRAASRARANSAQPSAVLPWV